MDAALFLQSAVNGLMLSLLYILVALGLTLILGVMHMVNFAHGDLYMLGAFGSYVLFAELGINYFLALAFAMLLIGLLGMVVERVLIRPLHHEMLPCTVSTLGLSLFLQGSALLIFGPKDKAVHVVKGAIEFGGVFLSYERLLVIIISVAAVVALNFFVQRVKAGMAMRAVQQDPDGACLVGINVGRIRTVAYSLGCTLAGAAGFLIAPVFVINPTMGMLPLLKVFVIIVIGGLGSVTGAIIGGLILGFVESFGFTFIGSEITTMLAFALLVIVLIFRPAGLMGH